METPQKGMTYNKVSFAGLVLNGANVAGATFIECSFEGASFSKVNMTGCKFYGCNMDGVSFTGCTLDQALFCMEVGETVGLDLSGSSFKQGVIEQRAGYRSGQVIFKGLMAPKADFTEAKVSSCVFVGADFSRSKFFAAKMQFADLSYSQCEGADFTASDVWCTKFTGANLKRTKGGLKPAESGESMEEYVNRVYGGGGGRKGVNATDVASYFSGD